MKKSIFTNRIFAAILALMVTVSLTGGSVLEAFAEDVAQPANETETTAEEAVTDGEEQKPADEDEAQKAQAVEAAENADSAEGTLLDAAPQLITSEPAAGEADQTGGSESRLEEIAVTVHGVYSFITVEWNKADGAEYYKVYLDNDAAGVPVTAGEATEFKHIFKDVPGGTHTVTVEAYRKKEAAAPAEGEEPAATKYELFAKGVKADIKTVVRESLQGLIGTRADYLGLSLRPLLGEGNGGYAVAQGAATDGTYAYYMMASSENQKGRIIKIRLSDNAVVGCGPEIGIHHANGMTYDNKRDQLVAVGYGTWRNQLSFIDPNSLKLKEKENVEVKYPYAINGVTEAAKENGFGAIAYVKEYDVFVARSRGRNNGVGDSNFNNDIWVIKPDSANDYNVIGHVYTHVTGSYPERYQSMDADAKYVYYLLSPGSGQKHNIILALDWNSEELRPVLSGEKKYVENTWKCKKDRSGNPDAVLTIPIGHESEGLFHTTNADGSGNFYVSEYYGRWMYKTVKKKVKVKVKWKKVRKWYNKKTGKWQKKKPKKKYRGKSKKVWKYKYKKKKKKVTVKDYWARDDYVYFIGRF